MPEPQAVCAQPTQERIVQPGDTVTLKSGGPLMVAGRFDQEGNMVCMWFPESHPTDHGSTYLPEVQWSSFPLETLKIIF